MVKDRKFALNHHKFFARAQWPPNARGYGAGGMLLDYSVPPTIQEGPLQTQS
tara:strand:- start:302 stop:457 length:156 start_codon:yes stop_codon:yes gene_type:complete